MDRKEIGEEIYDAMLKKVFLEYIEILTVQYKPRLLLLHELAYVDAKIDGYISIGKTKSLTQKRRAKSGLMNDDTTVPELVKFINGCFEEQKLQLLRNLKRALGESPEYSESEIFLVEVVEEETDKIKKLIKKELKNG